MDKVTGNISIIFFPDDSLTTACQDLAGELLSENASYTSDRFYVSLYTAEVEDVPFDLLQTLFEMLVAFTGEECTLKEIRVSEDKKLEYAVAENNWLPTLHKAVLSLGDYVPERVKAVVRQELKNTSEGQEKNIELFGTWRALEYLQPAVVLGRDKTLASRAPIENIRPGTVAGFAIVRSDQFGTITETLLS